MSENELLESGWSEKVSNDPKHRPQVLDRPSTTVRKEWCRRPQERLAGLKAAQAIAEAEIDDLVRENITDYFTLQLSLTAPNTHFQ